MVVMNFQLWAQTAHIRTPESGCTYVQSYTLLMWSFVHHVSDCAFGNMVHTLRLQVAGSCQSLGVVSLWVCTGCVIVGPPAVGPPLVGEAKAWSAK